MSKVSRLPVLCVLGLAALASCASAAQAQVTVGQLGPSSPPATCGGTSADAIQASSSTAPNPFVIPAAGVITSWSTNAGPGAGQLLELKVFRPIGGTNYTVLAHQGPVALAPSSLNTFTATVPVQAGDMLGFNTQTGGGVPNACLIKADLPGDIFAAALSDTPDGSTAILPPIAEGFRLNLSATLQKPPTLASLGPATGSIKGGTAVKLTGTELNGASAVSFGAKPAKSYTVDSESQITAIAPPSTSIAKVPVTVTTVAGTVSRSYSYRGCKVPTLTGKTLKVAKKKLKKADCKIGTVTKKEGASAATGKVKKQSPKAGKVLAPGSKVKVTLKP